ncbi:MAG: PBP1A family penicillin-binding protein [Patescibacteria group bacterium]
MLKGIFLKFKRFVTFIDSEVEKAIRYVIRACKSLWRSKKLHTRDIVFIAIAGLFVAIGGGLLWFSSLQIPDIASFEQRILGQSTKIYDRTGTILLYDLSQNMRRTAIPFDQISPYLKEASISIEDEDFYQHSGIKISSIIRSFLVDVFSMKFSQGGSTITQQVVKNALLTRQKTIQRKIQEIFLAIKLDRTLTKDQILNLYLNDSSYGGTIYGVEEASQAYFGKDANDLTPAEAAYLAALPQSPTYYSPYGSHRDELDQRKDLVLQKMHTLKYLTDKQYTDAKAEKIVFQPNVSGGIKAPHFVMYIKQYLEEHYGDQMLTDGGLKVITTLNYDLEKHAEEIVNKYALTDAKLYHATNAALVTIDAPTGQILTMVGSRDYFDKEIDGNYNVATAKRQPGSSFKPFVYAAAFNMGYRPETTLYDLPIQFGTECAADDLSDTPPCYAPQDYDGKWRGPISIRNALAGSINLPAVETLYLVGMNNAIDLAEKMGISTLADRSRFGLSLVLGGGEVTLTDMTGAYSVFANSGVKHPTTGILKIQDKAGNVLEEYSEQSEEVLPKDTALLISDVLSDNTARTPVFGAHSSLYFGDRDVAAKTGTTNDYRDTWVVGYTPQVTVGAWMGNNDNTPIARQVAGYIVAPMWHEYMNYLLTTLPDQKFEAPEQKDLSGLKPVINGTSNGAPHSILYYVSKEDPNGAAPTNPANDPQFSHWEYAVGKWSAENGYAGGMQTSPSNILGGTNSLSISISNPQNGATLSSGSRVDVSVNTSSINTISKVDYFLQGAYLGSSQYAPYGFSFVLDDTKGTAGQNTLRAIATDSTGFQSAATVTFTKQ